MSRRTARRRRQMFADVQARMRLPQRPERARSPARPPAISSPSGPAFSRLAHPREAAQAVALLQSARPDPPGRRPPARPAQIPAGFRRPGYCFPLQRSVQVPLSVEARLPPLLRPLAPAPACPRARGVSPLWKRSQLIAEAARTVESLRSALALLPASRKPRKQRAIGFAPPGRHLHIAPYRHLDHRRIEAGRLLQAYHSNCKTARDQVALPGNGCIDASDSFPLM